MRVKTIGDLEALYGTPKPASIVKVSDHITPEYRAWINASPFCALATVGPEGADCTPRGDAGQVVFELDEFTYAMPDRRGNDRIDSLRNIVEDGRVSLMFLIPTSGTIIRVNGSAYVTTDQDLLTRFTMEGKLPRSVIIIKVSEIYFQCARAIMRSGLWDTSVWADTNTLPSLGTILSKQTNGEVGGQTYDDTWLERAKGSLW